MATMPSVRPARDAELDPLAGVYERASFSPRLAAINRFVRESLGGQVFVAERDGALVGASGCAHFGATGWVGGVAVVPEARRAGLGHALTEAAVAWLLEHGASTIQLYATDMGRPVYERLGFADEGGCVTLAGPWRPRPGPAGVRPAHGGDLQAALAVDREVTGEDRTALLTALWPGAVRVAERPGAVRVAERSGAALVAEADGEIRGYYLPSPWRPGGGTVAADLASGLALIEASTARLNGAALSLSIPEGNLPAIDALRARGQTERSRVTRMRLGPPLPWRPSGIFSTFNFFWG